jgi:hypothetical protein
MAITVLTPVKVKLDAITAETTDNDFVAVDATLGAYFEYDAKDERVMVGIKNDVAVADYYAECANTVTGAIEVAATATTGKIAYNAEGLVDATGTALYSEAPTGKYVQKISGTKTVTVVKGDGLHSPLGDLVATVAPNAIAWTWLTSARFKNLTGDNKGRVIIKGTDAHVLVKVLKEVLV